MLLLSVYLLVNMTVLFVGNDVSQKAHFVEIVKKILTLILKVFFFLQKNTSIA